MSNFRKAIPALILILLVQGCAPAQTFESEPQTTDDGLQAAVTAPPSTVAPLPTRTVVPTTTEIPPTSAPKVTITATKGNLYIRRGPGLPYNQIGILYQDASAEIIGRDVLSRWVQVNIPNSDQTGWVSIMTDFTSVDGDLDSVPNFTFTDWPLPAYVKNCTEHDLVLEPGDIYLYNLWTNSQYLNEAQINPGLYTVYDLFLPGAPEVQKVNIKEGMTVYITVNGLGVSHKCP
jgi:hypothetical protein